MREELVIAYHAGTAIALVRSAKHSRSVFGGPLGPRVTGAHLEKPLHHIATLSPHHLGLPEMTSEIPLVYGFVYDGCSFRYSFENHRDIVIQSGPLGSSTADWPYRGYPELLPYVPLERGSTTLESWEEFSRRATNLPPTQPSELVLIVPPPATLGFSMWGPVGDAEDVTVVFECDLNRQTMTTYNVCG